MDIRTNNGTRYYSGEITPGEGIVFVFGSNPEGRHGAGAAKVARERFGAIYGQGEGLQGNAYALPTKDLRVKENRSLRSISPEAITENVRRLYETARQNPDKTFCIAYRNTDRQSLNGYTGIEMMRMFNAAGQMPDNVVVSKEWADTGLLRRASESEYLAEGNDNILKQYDAYRVIAPGVNLAVDTRMDNIRDWFEIVDDNGERIVRAANYVQELREYESAHFENPVVGPDGSVTLDAIAHVIYPEGEVETSEMAHPVKFSAQELQELVSERKIRESETRKVATDNDIVLSSDGQPLVLWHGSPAEFEEFDFSHAGDNTGLVEYTDKQTGEKTVSDSDKAIFFTDNRELAISYGFLARTQELQHLTGLMTDIISCLRDPEHSITDYIKSKKDLVEAVRTLRGENDTELNAFLDRLPDLNGEKPLSSMDVNTREELRNDLIQIRSRFKGYFDMNRNGGISNRLNNFVRTKDYLQYFVENFDRLCDGDTTVMTEHGDDFNHYNQTFYSSDGNYGVSFILDGNEIKVSGFTAYGTIPVKTLTTDQRKEILQRIEDDINACIEKYNAELEESGYRKHTHLYPVYLKAKSPLVHDYQGSAFPDKYKPNEKYETAYISARQVKKALADGNDAVVYKNIRDPFLGDTYGVFSKESIVMLDKSLLPEEQLDSTLGKVSGTVQSYMDTIEQKNMEQELRPSKNQPSPLESEEYPLFHPSEIEYALIGKFFYDDTFTEKEIPIDFTRANGKRYSFVTGDYVRNYEDNSADTYVAIGYYDETGKRVVVPARETEAKEMNAILYSMQDNEIREDLVHHIKESRKENKTSIVTFIEDDSPYYKERTRRNAEAADVTIAFAVDFNTAGEKCTRNVAGDKYVAINLPPLTYYKNPDNIFNRAMLKERVEKIEAEIIQLSDKYGFLPVEVNVNVAGNGLYTLAQHGISQADVDLFVTNVFRLIEGRPNIHVSSIRSGGQTGIDEAGIKAAAALDIQATVLAPKGWKFRDESGKDISDEKAFKARFPEGPVKKNGMKPLSEDEMRETSGGVRVDEPKKQAESGMKPLSEEEMRNTRGGVEVAQQPAPPADAFKRIAEAAVASGKVKSVGELKDGWALVQASNGKYNFADAKGQFMTKRWLDKATEFSNGFATVERDGCKARINTGGIAVEVKNNMVQKTGNSPKIG